MRTGHEVGIISRHPEKVQDFVEAGASLTRGSIDDQDVVSRALKGADAVFWLTPIAFDQPHYLAWARRVGEAAAETARRQSVRRAVVLSSIGGDHATGVGPLSCLPAIEGAFSGALPDVTILRPGSFMENHFMNVASIAKAGTIYGRYPSGRKLPWIATRDIAEKAIEALTLPLSTGTRVLELHGPEDIDPEQSAQIIGSAVGRPVRYVEVTSEQAMAGMVEAGMPASFAALLSEMYDGLLSGRIARTQPRSAATTTRTTLAQFARYALKPAVEAALKA
jgi:uncharacterized protein YbjT (DUF2867 family)